MKNYYFLLTGIFIVLSCSDDAPVAGCFQEAGRNIVTVVNNVNGSVIFNEDCGYLIEPVQQLNNNPTNSLSPCNLEAAFETDSLQVTFSGYIYESFDNEDICADFFEITEIEIVSPNQ